MFRRSKPKKPSPAVRGFRDGPLSIRPPEEIVFGTGKSVLGPILVASSDKGIVSIMIRDRAEKLERDLRARFPKAAVIRDEKGCKPLVAKAIRFVAAPVGRFELSLDLRGTPFQQRVWQEVLKIPFGQTSTYTKIAEAIGAPRAVRAVGSSCTHNWFAFAVPCHRVLHKGSADPAGNARRDGRQYRWVDYEAGLMAEMKTRKRQGPLLHRP